MSQASRYNFGNWAPSRRLTHHRIGSHVPVSNFRRKLEVLFELIDYWLIFEAEVDSEDGDV